MNGSGNGTCGLPALQPMRHSETHISDDFSISYGDRVFIGDIVDDCAPYTTSQLTEITRHQSPWMDTYHAGHRVISEAAIAKFFST